MIFLTLFNIFVYSNRLSTHIQSLRTEKSIIIAILQKTFSCEIITEKSQQMLKNSVSHHII